MSTVGFPGFGWEFTMNKTAFTIFGMNIQWYGIIITVGIIAAFILFYRRAIKTEGILEDDVLNITLFTVPIAIIGARITYFLTSLDQYDSFLDIFKIWEGGIAIYGAIIFGAATVIIYCKIKRLNSLKVFDSLAPAVMMGQIIGRWGNFINAEAYGYSAGIEKLPWRMTVGNVKIDGVYDPTIQFVHPTFLYESLWNLIGFIIISLIYKKKKADGQIIYMYLAWYGLGRGLIEVLRTDSLRIFGVKIFVILGLGSFVLFTTLLILLLKKSKKYSNELEEYAAAYGDIEPFTLNQSADNEQEPDEDEDPAEPASPGDYFEPDDDIDDEAVPEPDFAPETPENDSIAEGDIENDID